MADAREDGVQHDPASGGKVAPSIKRVILDK